MKWTLTAVWFALVFSTALHQPTSELIARGMIYALVLTAVYGLVQLARRTIASFFHK